MSVELDRPILVNDNGDRESGTLHDEAWWEDLFDRIDDAFAELSALSLSNNFTATQFIGDTSNAMMSLGLTINQGAADDEILSLKSSDVAHGMTSIAETDTFGFAAKASGGSGGLQFTGLSEGQSAVVVRGMGATADTTKSTGAVGAVNIYGYAKSGTSVGSLGANGNILVVGDQATARFILDADGDSHQDVGTLWTNFDSHDDLTLLNSLALHVSRPDDPWREGIRQAFGRSLGAMLSKAEIQRLGLVTFNRNGHHFLNTSRLTMLHTGAIRQIGQQLTKITRAMVAARLLEA